MRNSAAIYLALAIGLGCSPGERQVNTYETIEAARSDRLFARGWVPDVLPSEPGPIVEVHDLDTNARCSRSVFPSASADDVADALVVLEFAPYRGDLPRLPLSICPFNLSEISEAARILTRLRAESSDVEFAAVANEALFIWSARK